jgi:integrase
MRSVGPKRSKAQPGGLTQPQAEAAFRRMRDEVKHATVPRSERRTVVEVGEAMIQAKRLAGRKTSTVESIDSILRIHIKPYFGTALIAKVNREQLRSFVSELSAKKLSPKTVGNVLGVLHSIFEYALDEEWLTGENIVKRVSAPQEAASDATIRFLEPEEVEALIRAVPDDALGRVESVMYLTAAMTGMRQGELLALQWSDIDWTASRIRVRRAWVRNEITAPKSKRSSRSVPLATRVATELERLYKDSGEPKDDALVFAHPATGKPIDRSKLLKRFKAALLRAAVGQFAEIKVNGKVVRKPLTRFHDLRHTFGTRMAASGVPMRTLQEMLGHADFGTTLIYADYAPGAHEAEWVEAAFGTAVLEAGAAQGV